jgi:hypothetical protein
MPEPPTRHVAAALAAGIRAMQEMGELPASLDIDKAAAASLAGIQGRGDDHAVHRAVL